jgi:PhzF family phenazine biosynthesis protein
MTRRFTLVDVFADGALTGNPLAVVHAAQGLDHEAMLRLTRWFNFSETAFLLPAEEAGADYRVRIFTPDRELRFAGHPTLGSAHAWLAAGGKARVAGRLVQQCGAGLVPLRLAGGRIGFAAPPLVREGALSAGEAAEVLDFLSLETDAVAAMAWTDNGPGWVAVELADADAVLAVRPPARWPRRIEVGLVGAYPAGGPLAYEVRTFFTDQHLMVREDPVTGSFNAAVAGWLRARGRVAGQWVAAQGQCLGHGGRVHLEASGETLWVSGVCRTIVEGVLG